MRLQKRLHFKIYDSCDGLSWGRINQVPRYLPIFLILQISIISTTTRMVLNCASDSMFLNFSLYLSHSLSSSSLDLSHSPLSQISIDLSSSCSLDTRTPALLAQTPWLPSSPWSNLCFYAVS